MPLATAKLALQEARRPRSSRLTDACQQPCPLEGLRGWRYAWRTVFDGEDEAQISVTTIERSLASLTRHPERASAALMRADILHETSAENNVAESGWRQLGFVSRRLVPRNPRKDQPMVQDCFMFSRGDVLLAVWTVGDETLASGIPYYHPRVRALAFEFRRTDAELRIAHIPLAEVADDDDKVLRTLQNLLLLVRQFALTESRALAAGQVYTPRVVHDVVVGRERYQDRQQQLKLAYAAHYVSQWAESTSPGKHVFEDICIAAWLLELWSTSSPTPVAFVDVGCGNGLLVDILLREGLKGYGFDLRARKSWSHELLFVPAKTPGRLITRVLCPSFIDDDDVINHGTISDLAIMDGRFAAEEFLIGNHADELTPWIPLLAALSSPAVQGECAVPGGFMVIPCCTHGFDGSRSPQYTRPLHRSTGGDAGLRSRYARYVAFLIEVAESVGWRVEREFLRIPSTRNIALIGRVRNAVELTDRTLLTDDERAHGTSVTQQTLLTRLCRKVVNERGGARGFLEHARSLATAKSSASH
ncbi:tRNA(Ser) Um(44) 2'-O-methyltransferase [Savitreella phatthalungensis]